MIWSLHLFRAETLSLPTNCTYTPFYMLHKGTLAECPRAYAKPNLVFICCCAEPRWWADSHKLTVKGTVFFFDGGWGGAPWSLAIPPRHPRRSCTASLWHNLHQAASKQHSPLQNITSAISVWIRSGGLCRWVRDGMQERARRGKGRRALKLASVPHWSSFCSPKAACMLSVSHFIRLNQFYSRWKENCESCISFHHTVCAPKLHILQSTSV